MTNDDIPIPRDINFGAIYGRGDLSSFLDDVLGPIPTPEEVQAKYDFTHQDRRTREGNAAHDAALAAQATLYTHYSQHVAQNEATIKNWLKEREGALPARKYYIGTPRNGRTNADWPGNHTQFLGIDLIVLPDPHPTITKRYIVKDAFFLGRPSEVKRSRLSNLKSMMGHPAYGGVVDNWHARYDNKEQPNGE